VLEIRQRSGPTVTPVTTPFLGYSMNTSLVRPSALSSRRGIAVAAATDAVLVACDDAEALLSTSERERAAAFRRPSDRRDFVAAHALVRLCAAAVLGEGPATLAVVQCCERCGGAHGQPVLADRSGWHVSLAHASGVVAAAVAPAGVGVDVEGLDTARFAHGLPATVMTADELARVTAAASSGEAFLRVWVRKEALVKLGVADLDRLARVDAAASFPELCWLDWTHAAPPAVASAVSHEPLELVSLDGLRG